MKESPNELYKITDKPNHTVNVDESIEIENPSTDRYTIIRDQKIDTREYGADFSAPTEFGINVMTDSDKLAREVAISTKQDVINKTEIEFVYLTKRGIDPLTDIGTPIRSIQKGVLGDLVVDNDLKQYAMAGPDKFGSMESILFGIYSFERAREGFVGIHAAQVYDRKMNVNHIIIGNSGIGKSTISQFLESMNPSRFVVLADDWVEFDPDLRNVRPISRTFGSNDNTLNNELLVHNNRIEDKFVSFEKNFNLHKPLKKTERDVGMIIQLRDPFIGPNDNVTLESFIRINRHIPFMTQVLREYKYLPLRVRQRLDIILNGYDRLMKSRFFVSIDLNGMDINKKIAKVLDIIK